MKKKKTSLGPNLKKSNSFSVVIQEFEKEKLKVCPKTIFISEKNAIFHELKPFPELEQDFTSKWIFFLKYMGMKFIFHMPSW